MFNYYDTHLLKKKSMLEPGVTVELELLCNSIITAISRIKEAKKEGHLIPAHMTLDTLLSVAFYINKYIEANGLDVNKYLEVVDDAVWSDMLATGAGKKVSVLYDRPMFVAGPHGNSSTTAKIFELLDYDIAQKAKVLEEDLDE